MTRDETLDVFREAGAYLEGHFILSSGKRSPAYVQCARVMMRPEIAERLCAELAALIRERLPDRLDLVVSPAMGGVIVGYEVARQLGLPSIFAERVEGAFQFRRGFEVPRGARCLIVEDVVTTGLSSRECMEAVRDAGGVPVAVASLVDRTGGDLPFDVPLVSILPLAIPIYDVDNLPEALAAIAPTKPGSRGLSASSPR